MIGAWVGLIIAGVLLFSAAIIREPAACRKADQESPKAEVAYSGPRAHKR